MALDQFGQMALQRYIDIVSDYNSKVQKTKAVSSKEEFEAHFVENAPELAEINAEVERIRSALESALARRVVQATPLVEPAYEAALKDTGVDLTALDEQLKTIKVSKTYLTSNYGEDVLEGTPDIERRRTSNSGSTGTSGGRRIRGFDIYVNGVLAQSKNAKGEMRSTLSIAAKTMNVDTTALQRAFFEAAGGEDPNAEGFPTVVEFEFDGNKIRATKVGDSDDE